MAYSSATIEPDLSDIDSVYPDSVNDANCTTSITSSALNYQYHSYHEGEYLLPNDEQEQDRLDLSHHIYLMLLKGELHRAPVENPGRVLDLGTGTGIWAIDFAEVPPNCKFEVDDFEQPWNYNAPFDYIHGRELEGAIRDHKQLFQQAFDNLKPNGWFEMATFEVNTMSDDGTHLKSTYLLNSVKNIYASARSFGKAMHSVPSWSDWIKKAGFVNVREEIYKLPQSPWSKDPEFLELGKYHQLNMLEAMPSYTYALFTRVLRWERVEIEALLAGVRRELRDLSNHLYTRVYMIYGQRPP
ncbi:hypothetical protein N7481_001432 [Penicillium waksmanii]|uniref:uncharacterized protein n=1 Tax=Penicillium waksmanii TaxID=69791 RepID=UPI00254886F8|nr:uncharacterized protein N7481_001432 [Penicillium waksmanii]KAJ6001023.1 hypothetical protein N7481_001432 [Penicillium waksmanii]